MSEQPLRFVPVQRHTQSPRSAAHCFLSVLDRREETCAELQPAHIHNAHARPSLQPISVWASSSSPSLSLVRGESRRTAGTSGCVTSALTVGLSCGSQGTHRFVVFQIHPVYFAWKIDNSHHFYTWISGSAATLKVKKERKKKKTAVKKHYDKMCVKNVTLLQRFASHIKQCCL